MSLHWINKRAPLLLIAQGKKVSCLPSPCPRLRAHESPVTSDPASMAGAAVTCPSSRDSPSLRLDCPSRLCQGQVPSGPDGKPWTPWRARKLYVPPGATSARGARGDRRAGSGHPPGPCGEFPAGHTARPERQQLLLPGRRWPSAGAEGLTAVGAAASAAVLGPLSGDTDWHRGVHGWLGPLVRRRHPWSPRLTWARLPRASPPAGWGS